MAGSLTVRWALTAVFAAAAAGLLPARGRAGAYRPSAALHLLMCAALIVMTWRSRLALPLWFQVAAFGCPVIWFELAGLTGSGRQRTRVLSSLHHTLMAGAMIWMITAMPRAMRMGPATNSAVRSVMPAKPGLLVPAVSALLAAYFALAAVPWMVTAFSNGRDMAGAARAAAGHAAMSAGMAAMLLAMLPA